MIIVLFMCYDFIEYLIFVFVFRKRNIWEIYKFLYCVCDCLWEFGLVMVYFWRFIMLNIIGFYRNVFFIGLFVSVNNNEWFIEDFIKVLR